MPCAVLQSGDLIGRSHGVVIHVFDHQIKTCYGIR